MTRMIGFLFLLLLHQNASADWNTEIALQGSLLFTSGNLGKDFSATGDEKLIARLDWTPALGIRAGIHKNKIGLETNIFWYARKISVENEFGVDFPDHGSTPFSFSSSAVLRSGTNVQPYLSLGGGFFLLSVDLNNLDGQKLFLVPALEVAPGVKIHSHGEGKFLYLEYRFYKTFERHLIRPLHLHSFIFGFGFTR